MKFINIRQTYMDWIYCLKMRTRGRMLSSHFEVRCSTESNAFGDATCRGGLNGCYCSLEDFNNNTSSMTRSWGESSSKAIPGTFIENVIQYTLSEDLNMAMVRRLEGCQRRTCLPCRDDKYASRVHGNGIHLISMACPGITD